MKNFGVLQFDQITKVHPVIQDLSKSIKEDFLEGT